VVDVLRVHGVPPPLEHRSSADGHRRCHIYLRRPRSDVNLYVR
jgi:hypothetical protein